MSELAVIAVVALIFVGPQRLPGLLRTAGEWIGKLRRLTTEVRAQTGIDEILREEGIDGVRELRSLLRGEVGNRNWGGKSPVYEGAAEPQLSDEYPVEGADAGNALPDDLWNPDGTNPSSPAPSEDLAPDEIAQAPESERLKNLEEIAQPESALGPEAESAPLQSESEEGELPPRAGTPAP